MQHTSDALSDGTYAIKTLLQVNAWALAEVTALKFEWTNVSKDDVTIFDDDSVSLSVQVLSVDRQATIGSTASDFDAAVNAADHHAVYDMDFVYD